VRLANGSQRWALIGNIDTGNPRSTEHFLILSIDRDGKWFTLARYHDFDYADCGPEVLSRFLELTVDEIFPISFDVRPYTEGDPAALVGTITKEPRERRSEAELMAMAVT